MTMMLSGGTVIDGTGAEPLQDAVVVVEGARIAYVGPAAEAGSIGQNARRIDVKGRTILPGLINSHVHLCIDPEGEYGRPKIRDTATNTLQAYAYALQCLNAGVTTVCDLSAPHHGFIGLAQMIDNGILTGPTIVNVGRGLAVSGGHAHYLGREVDGPVEAAKAIREEIRAGADQVKLLAEAGSMEDALELRRLEMSTEEIQAAASAAYGFGRTVRGHLLTSSCVKAGVRLGIRVVEHGYELDDEAIDLLVQTGTYLVPTAQVWKMPLIHPRANEKSRPVELRKAVQTVVEESLPRAIAAGVKIALGTDGNTVQNPSWEVVVELQFYRDCGMPPLEVIRSATLYAAEACDRGDSLGSLTPGKLADVIVVDGNPLEDLEALRRVEVVVKNGRVVRAA